MSLAPGTRLGVYEITAPLGEGGMGQVWRATDTTLGRQVAIKILPDAFASDPERLARFEREAKTLASLNHPHIAAIYGFERSSGLQALVMELVEGEDLSQRLARGSLPVDEALPIAKQIAEALEAAHEQGIVHRDLKPANIKVRVDGTVKVLDFGLAKAVDAPAGGDGRGTLANSPTITSPAAMTAHGIILGTAAYMAPEQAKGRAVDKRADIWAFGVVLHEMLTGQRLFDAEDLSETLAAVLTRDVSKTVLPSGVPLRVRALLRDCLVRDPRQRLRDIGDARIAIQHCLSNPAEDALSAAGPTATRSTSKMAWAVAGVMGAAVVALVFGQLNRAPAEVSRVHLSMALPDNRAPTHFALSPDGRSLVMGVPGALAIRSLETGETRTLPGTAGYRTPFWSPDSRTVAFFADGKLKTVPASGGPPQVLCEDAGVGLGGTWSRTGTILFATEAGSLRRVPGEGGVCTPLSNTDSVATGRLPVFLPDGEHFFYVSTAAEASARGLFVASLTEPAGRRLLADRSSALFVPNAIGATRGRMLFVRQTTLYAQAFDTASLQLSGEPETVAEGVGFTSTIWQIAVTTDRAGSVMFVRNNAREQRLTWYDRAGALLGQLAPADLRFAIGIDLAPDGKRLAFTRSDAEASTALWTHDLDRLQDVRLTADGRGANAPVWSPDSQRLAYTEGGNAAIKVTSVNGGAEQTLLERAGVSPSDWSHDDRWLVYTQVDPVNGADIWLLADPSKPSPDRRPQPLLQSRAVESQAQISPDGRWLAYYLNQSGVSQVQMRPFAGSSLSEDSWNISASSTAAYQPRWRADAKELFYLQGAVGSGAITLMAVPIAPASGPAGAPKALFEFQSSTVLPQYNRFLYSPAPDGQRFLVSVFSTTAEPTLEFILNWGATTKP